MVIALPLLILATASQPTAWPAELEAPLFQPQAETSSSSKFSYRYAELNYEIIDDDSFSDDFTGLDARVSFDFADNFYVFGSYGRTTADVSGSDVDVDDYRIGVGFHTPIMEKLDFVGDAAFVRAEAEGAGGSADQDGFALRAGVRYWLIDKVELNGGIEYIDLDSSDTGFSAGGRYYITDPLSVGAEYTYFDDSDRFSFGVRYSF